MAALVDTAALSSLLQDLQNAIGAAVPELLDAMAETGPLVAPASEFLQKIGGDTKTLEQRTTTLVSEMRTHLSADGGGATAAAVSAREQVARADKLLTQLQHASRSMAQIQQVRQALIRTADLLAEGAEDVAADALFSAESALLEVQNSFLLSVVSDKAELDAISFPLKAEIRIQREELKKLIWSQLESQISFQARRLFIRTDGQKSPDTSRERLWHAVTQAGLYDSVLTYCADKIIRQILQPLCVACECYEHCENIAIVDKVQLQQQQHAFPEGCQSLVDSWEFLPVTLPEGGASSPAVKQIPVILICMMESLAEFMASRLAPGHPNVLLDLGEKIYKEVACILQQMVLEGAGDDVLASLKNFEFRLQGLQFIGPDTNTLHEFCRNHETLMFYQRQNKLLTKVVALSEVPCSSSRRVGKTADDDNRYDEMMKAIKKLEKALERISAPEKKRQAAALLSSLRESSLCLPDCIVSTSAYEILGMAEDLLLNERSDENDEMAMVAAETAQNFITVYLTLRLSKFQKELTEDPTAGSIFFNDCGMILLRLLTCAAAAPPAAMHLLLTVRTVQEASLLALMNFQREALLSSFKHLGDLARLNNDVAYAKAEAAIATGIQLVKKLATAWAVSFPQPVTAHCVGSMVDLLLQTLDEKISDDVERTTGAPAASQALAMRALGHLCLSVAAQLQPVVLAHCSAPLGTPNPLLALLAGKNLLQGCTASRWANFEAFCKLIDADETAGTACISSELTTRQTAVAMQINQWVVTTTTTRNENQ